jgi:hypothetical protein
MSEKRAELRIPLMARVDVLWDDQNDAPRIAPGTLEDRSYGGLSVRMQTAIRVRSHVTVRWGSEQVCGIVTHCRPDQAGYIIGVRREIGVSVD